MPSPDEVSPLERSADRKTAPHLSPAGSGWRVTVANSHGFPAGVSCPGRTATCAGPTHELAPTDLEALAADALERAGGVRGRDTTWRVVLPDAGLDPTWPCYAVADLRRGTEENACWRNWDQIRDHLDDPDQLTAVVSATLAAFAADCDAAGVPKLYRVHWDGDVASESVAVATAAAFRAHPDVAGWIYTRSLDWVHHLVEVPNLVVYVSADIDNHTDVAELLDRFPDVHVAALGVDGNEAAKVLELLGRARSICPVDTGRMPVVVAPSRRGEPTPGDDAVGACVACGLCVWGRKDVRFTIRKTLWSRKNITMPARVVFDDDTGPDQLFKDRHRDPRTWWATIDAALAATDVTRVWRRLSVAYRVGRTHVASAQPRGGGRLVVTVSGAPPSRFPSSLSPRDISRIGHQMAGTVELTVTSERTARVAARQLVRVAKAADDTQR